MKKTLQVHAWHLISLGPVTSRSLTWHGGKSVDVSLVMFLHSSLLSNAQEAKPHYLSR